MKLHYNLFILFFSFALAINAKEKIKYPVADIPKELLENAHAVIREVKEETELISETKMVTHTKKVITILKESALELSYFKEYYDPMSKIDNIEAVVYDKTGKRIEKIKQDDIIDRSAISGFSLYEDDRVKLIDPKCTDYPFTVEYTFSRRTNNTLFMPIWSFYEGMNTSIESSLFSIKVPKAYKLNYKEHNITQGVDIIKDDETYTYQWMANNIKAISPEPLSAPIEHWAPLIITAPSNFEIRDYKGNMNTWANLGSFHAQLLDGRNNIPEETINEIKNLLPENASDYEKVSLIYQFSQKKNRYISIQEDIGGQQPFDAKTVDRLSYGDCKALTNYVMSILNYFGYKSHYTLVNAGNDSEPVSTNFVASRFNHAFLCVELPNDTLWIECTNSHSPCGYIGDFTDDRYVLIVKKEGSELVKTPAYAANENQQTIKANINIDTDGWAEANLNVTYSGALYGDYFGLTLLDDLDQRKRIIKSIDIPNFKLQDYTIEVEKKRQPKLHKSLNLTLPDYTTKLGSRILLKTNKINDISQIPAYARNRKTPLYIKRNYSECDTLIYSIPAELKVEATPKAVDISTPYGSYRCNTETLDDKLVVYRYFELKKGLFPKEEYNTFREFLEKVSVADNATTILIPKS